MSLKNNSVKILVPATSANCGPGFDCLGLATTLYNETEISLLAEENVTVDFEGEGLKDIPKGAENLIWQSAKMVIERAGYSEKFKGANIRMKNNIPVSRGLGSSSAAIVGGLFAANEILERPFDKTQLLEIATEIEGHPDNVAPAILGGFTVSTLDGGKVHSFSFMPKIKLKLIVAVPDFQLATSKARAVLPEKVSRKDAIFNISRAAMLVAALLEGRENFLRTAFEDAIHQPYRAKLIPGMEEVFAAAKKAGASGVAISGAGSCLIAFALEKLHAEKDIAEEMVAAFRKNEVDSKALILDVSETGARVR